MKKGSDIWDEEVIEVTLGKDAAVERARDKALVVAEWMVLLLLAQTAIVSARNVVIKLNMWPVHPATSRNAPSAAH